MTGLRDTGRSPLSTQGTGVLIATKAGLLAVYSGPDRVVKQAWVKG